MSRNVEVGAFERATMVYDKEALLVPEPLLKRRLEFLRAEYDREHERPAGGPSDDGAPDS